MSKCELSGREAYERLVGYNRFVVSTKGRTVGTFSRVYSSIAAPNAIRFTRPGFPSCVVEDARGRMNGDDYVCTHEETTVSCTIGPVSPECSVSSSIGLAALLDVTKPKDIIDICDDPLSSLSTVVNRLISFEFKKGELDQIQAPGLCLVEDNGDYVIAVGDVLGSGNLVLSSLRYPTMVVEWQRRKLSEKGSKKIMYKKEQCT